MRSLLFSRVTLIWSILVAATVTSWEMGHGMGFHDIRLAGVAIIVIALVKVRFVLQEFMEIRTAPIAMRIIGEVWVVLICTILVVLFLMAPLSV